MALTPTPPTLVLRFADVGVATYASLRVVGDPGATVSWVVDEPFLLTATAELDQALPEPRAGESVTDALQRALTTGAFADPGAELTLAYRLGALLLSDDAWTLLQAAGSNPHAVVFVSPSARLARVPWGLLARPTVRPAPAALMEARAAAATLHGPGPARIPWPAGEVDSLTDGTRLLELLDVLMAVPANVVHGRRSAEPWVRRADRPAVLLLDPRVPNQRPDSALGSVLGRPGADTVLAKHFASDVAHGTVRPSVTDVVDLFRRRDADRRWLADLLAEAPSRLVYVGHATADNVGRADQAALHLADERPLTASDVMAMELAMPPRVALLACASGGDYRFDEATGMVAALVLSGAELVTATLWTLPTTAGHRQFGGRADDPTADPMADVVAAVDRAHRELDAGRAVNRWQREQLRRWRVGVDVPSPVYWAALVTFAADGAR